VLYSTVPRQKSKSSANRHGSQSGHTGLLLCFLALTLSLLPISSTNCSLRFSPPPHVPACLQRDSSRISLSSSCDNCPRSVVPHSMISHSIVHSLDLPCTFTKSGHQICSASLCVPTVDGCYRSWLNLVVGYGLTSEVVLGDDWVAPCQPVLTKDHSTIQQPPPTLLDRLSAPHQWYRIPGSSLNPIYTRIHTYTHHTRSSSRSIPNPSGL